MLGRFLFSGRETPSRAVTALSGGERRRLSLALLVASGANFLVLDEPTNHLDLESREALEAALEAFPGTVLVVSHDRALLDAVPGSDRGRGGEVASLVRGRLGRQGREGRRGRAEAGRSPRDRRLRSRRARRRRSESRPPSFELVEAEIAGVEARVSELEGKLADDWSNMDVLAAHRAARDELQRLLERWETLFDDAQADAT